MYVFCRARRRPSFFPEPSAIDVLLAVECIFFDEFSTAVGGGKGVEKEAQSVSSRRLKGGNKDSRERRRGRKGDAESECERKEKESSE